VPRSRFLVLFTLLLIGLAGTVSPAAAQTSGPTCHGQAATIVVPSNQAEVRGTKGVDVIVVTGTLTGRTTVYGLGGNDSICATHGDIVYGGPGRDFISVHSRGVAGAEIHGEGGNDQIFGVDVSIASGGADDDRIDTRPTGTLTIEVFGGSGRDTFFGFADFCDGGPGRDSRGGGCDTVVSIP
jgi:hypothetical protein